MTDWPLSFTERTKIPIGPVNYTDALLIKCTKQFLDSPQKLLHCPSFKSLLCFWNPQYLSLIFRKAIQHKNPRILQPQSSIFVQHSAERFAKINYVSALASIQYFIHWGPLAMLLCHVPVLTVHLFQPRLHIKYDVTCNQSCRDLCSNIKAELLTIFS